MIKLIPVSDSIELNHDLRQIYLDSFPPEERREWMEINKLLNHPNFRLNQIFNDLELIGLISIWNLPDGDFIEHFAILESARGKGFGELVLKLIIEDQSKRIILEVEEPETEPARRRIAFYKRLGFSISDEIYYQPPYPPNKSKVKMLLMSFPEQLNPNDFANIKAQIYNEVYQTIE